MYRPCTSVTTDCALPVSVFNISTAALGKTPPEASFTVPSIVALETTWASSRALTARVRRRNRPNLISKFRRICGSPPCGWNPTARDGWDSAKESSVGGHADTSGHRYRPILKTIFEDSTIGEWRGVYPTIATMACRNRTLLNSL